MKVLVAGATGGLGRSLVPKLIAAGHEVTGMIRSESGAAGSAGVRARTSYSRTASTPPRSWPRWGRSGRRSSSTR